MESFKRETVKKHKNAMYCVIALSAPCATPIVNAVPVIKFAAKEMRELKIKIQAAYMIAVDEIPFTKIY